MKRSVMVCVALSILGLSAGAFAQSADGDASAPPPPQPATAQPNEPIAPPPPADATKAEIKEAPILFKKGLYGVLGGFSNSPFLIGAIAPADHALIGFGLSLTYNGNGNVEGAATPTTNKTAANIYLAFQYMLIDKAPFALGPEIQAIYQVAPSTPAGVSGLNTLVLLPGLAFWYAPFHAGLALGAALDVQIAIPAGASTIVNTLTPGVRAGYIW